MSLIKANTPMEGARETGQAEAEAWLKERRAEAWLKESSLKKDKQAWLKGVPHVM